MIGLKELKRDIWFGEKTNMLENEITFYKTEGFQEAVQLFELIKKFKQGNFEDKDILFKLINTSENADILNVALKLFVSIASVNDVVKIRTFIESAEEEQFNVLIAYAGDLLSYEIVPILLQELTIWEDTELGINIKETIGYLIGYYKTVYEDCSIEELEEAYNNFILDKDLTKFYYNEELVDVNKIMNDFIDKTTIAKTKGNPLKNNFVPSLLSKFSGIRCPADYHTVIDEVKMQEILGYVKEINELDWEVGVKYFYGHKVPF